MNRGKSEARVPPFPTIVQPMKKKKRPTSLKKRAVLYFIQTADTGGPNTPDTRGAT